MSFLSNLVNKGVVGAVVGASELPELDAFVEDLVSMDYSVKNENAGDVMFKYDKETERFLSRDLVEVRRRILERKIEKKREEYKAMIESYETRLTELNKENENVLRQYETRVSQLYDSNVKEKVFLMGVIDEKDLTIKRLLEEQIIMNERIVALNKENTEWRGKAEEMNHFLKEREDLLRYKEIVEKINLLLIDIK